MSFGKYVTGIRVTPDASATDDLLQLQSATGTTLVRVDVNGTQTVQIGAAANKGLIVRAAASQSANLQEWQNSSGTALARISENGQMMAAAYWDVNTQGSGGRMTLSANNASSTVAVFRGAASQTADLQQWQNSAGTVLTKVDSSGYVHFSELRGLSGTVYIRDSSVNTAIQIGTDVRFPRRNLITTNDALALSVQGTTNCLPDTATRIGLIVKGAASQTANLQEWQNSSATVLGKFDATGNMVVGNMAIATSSVATIHISNGTIPSADPTGGGVLYVEAGALKYRGSSGTITTIANA